MLPFRSQALISLVTHTESILENVFEYTPNQTCFISTEQGKRESPQHWSEDEMRCLAMLGSHLEY